MKVVEDELSVGGKSGGSLKEMLFSRFPEFDPKWTDEIKAKWFEAFERLMRSCQGEK